MDKLSRKIRTSHFISEVLIAAKVVKRYKKCITKFRQG